MLGNSVLCIEFPAPLPGKSQRQHDQPGPRDEKERAMVKMADLFESIAQKDSTPVDLPRMWIATVHDPAAVMACVSRNTNGNNSCTCGLMAVS